MQHKSSSYFGVESLHAEYSWCDWNYIILLGFFAWFSGNMRIKVIKTKSTWEGALNYCEQNHNGLLWIEDAEDQKAVEQWLNHTEVEGPFWIGLRQSTLFGFWIWKDRTVGYSNWKNGKIPAMPMSNHCGVIDKTSALGKWSDEDCWREHHFLCEEEIVFMNKK